MARPDLLKPDRKQFVGLLTQDPAEVLPEGAQVVEAVKPKPPMAMPGHVTSSYYSPTPGRSIAMALVKGGHARKRSAERRVGKESVSTGRSWWAAEIEKKKTKQKK